MDWYTLRHNELTRESVGPRVAGGWRRCVGVYCCNGYVNVAVFLYTHNPHAYTQHRYPIHPYTDTHTHMHPHTFPPKQLYTHSPIALYSHTHTLISTPMYP